MCGLSSKHFNYHNRVHNVESGPRTGLFPGNSLISWDIRKHTYSPSVQLIRDFQVISMMISTVDFTC